LVALQTTPTRLKHWLLAAAIMAAAAAILLALGRVPICKCGDIKVWHGIVNSAENSQHISDWYTPSHVIHGFAFYGLLWLLARAWSAARGRDSSAVWSVGTRMVAAVVIESGWEVLENTDLIINRYREATISLDYYGDSVLNSLCDIGAMLVGFQLAARLPVWITLAATLAMELFVGYMIRDNLLLNILMLLHPMDAIRRWQSGG
jgi:hypothetical protein